MTNYNETLDRTLGDILLEMEKLNLISKVNIIYWNPQVEKFKIIRLNPYEK